MPGKGKRLSVLEENAPLLNAVQESKLSTDENEFYVSIDENKKGVPGAMPTQYSTGRVHKNLPKGKPIEDLVMFKNESTFSVYRDKNREYQVVELPTTEALVFEDHRIVIHDAPGFPWQDLGDYEKAFDWCGLSYQDMGFDEAPDGRTYILDRDPKNRWLVHYNQRSGNPDGLLLFIEFDFTLYIAGICTNTTDSRKTYGLSISMIHLVKYLAEKSGRTAVNLSALRKPLPLYASLGFKCTTALDLSYTLNTSHMVWYFNDVKPQGKWPGAGIELIVWYDDHVMLGINKSYELKLARNGKVYHLENLENLVDYGYGYRTLPQESVIYNEKYLAIWLDDLVHLWGFGENGKLHFVDLQVVDIFKPDGVTNPFYTSKFSHFIFMRFFENVLYVLYGVNSLLTIDVAAMDPARKKNKRGRDEGDENDPKRQRTQAEISTLIDTMMKASLN